MTSCENGSMCQTLFRPCSTIIDDFRINVPIIIAMRTTVSHWLNVFVRLWKHLGSLLSKLHNAL